MTVDERVRPAAVYKPEVASLNMGSMNFALLRHAQPLQEIRARLGAEASAEQGHRVPQHLPGHRIRAEDAVGDRHPLRVRMLRHRASLQPQLLPRAGHGEAAAVRADGVRPAGRHRRASGGRAAHEAHRRPAVRRQDGVVGAGRRAQPTADRGDGRRHGRQYPRRPRRLAVGGARPDGGIERRAGHARPQDHRRSRACRWRPRTRPAKFSTSRAATSWKSDRFRQRKHPGALHQWQRHRFSRRTELHWSEGSMPHLGLAGCAGAPSW